MRLLALNVQHTGLRRAELLGPAILAAAPDVVALSEVKPGGGTDRLLALLAEGGLASSRVGVTIPGVFPYTVAVASREPLGAIHLPFQEGDFPQALMEVQVGGFTLSAVYFPLNRSKPRSRDHDRFWTETFLGYAKRLATQPAVVMGDWNTGSQTLDIGGSPVPGMAQFDAFVASGWTDAWRTKHPEVVEYTWRNSASGNGFRLDHALLSPTLAPSLMDALFLHDIRTSRASDHSGLLIHLDAGHPQATAPSSREVPWTSCAGA